MITEPANWIGKERHCRIWKPCILAGGGCRAAAGSRRAVAAAGGAGRGRHACSRGSGSGRRSDGGENQVLCETFEGSLTTTMARIILGSGQGNKHEVER